MPERYKPGARVELYDGSAVTVLKDNEWHGIDTYNVQFEEYPLSVGFIEVEPDEIIRRVPA